MTLPMLTEDDGSALSSAIWGWCDGHTGVYAMTPAAPVDRFHACGRCGDLIEPLEAFHRSKDGLVTWCDGCMMEEEASL